MSCLKLDNNSGTKHGKSILWWFYN